MSGKILVRENYEHSDLDHPLLPRNQKSWLNARTSLVRQVIRQLRREGVEIPPHNSEFVIACAASFRFSPTVNSGEMRDMVMKMTALFAESSGSKEAEPPLSAAC